MNTTSFEASSIILQDPLLFFSLIWVSHRFGVNLARTGFEFCTSSPFRRHGDPQGKAPLRASSASFLPAQLFEMSTPTLSITPLPFSSIPLTSSPDLAAWKSTLSVSAASLIASLATPSIWSTGKTYHGTQTLKALPGTPPGGGDTGGLKWHARVSKHSPKEGAWDEWKRELMQDHSVHEQQYVESCKEAKKVAVIEEGVLEGEPLVHVGGVSLFDEAGGE